MHCFLLLFASTFETVLKIAFSIGSNKKFLISTYLDVQRVRYVQTYVFRSCIRLQKLDMAHTCNRPLCQRRSLHSDTDLNRRHSRLEYNSFSDNTSSNYKINLIFLSRFRQERGRYVL